MRLLFPRGLSSTLTVAGLAALAKSGSTHKKSLKKRKTPGKKRKVTKRKTKKGGATKTSIKKRKSNTKKRTVKKLTHGKRRGASKCSRSKKGGSCGWKVVGGSKKSAKKRSYKRKQKGGGSDWMTVQYARGPSNTNDMTPGGSNKALFSNFADPRHYVSNTRLAKGWVTPQSAGVTSRMCGK